MSVLVETQAAVQLLAEWIDRQKFETQAQAAEFIGLHPMVLSQILGRQRRPGLAVAALIEDKTGIPCRSWALSELSKRKFPTGAAARKRRISRK